MNAQSPARTMFMTMFPRAMSLQAADPLSSTTITDDDWTQ